MEGREPSRSALLLAAARGIHRDGPPPLVLDDWLALELAGDEAPALADRLRADLPADALLAFSRWACVRARVAEDAFWSAVESGVRQYVVLGAGLDSFAYRCGERCDGIRVFEVDHPASQEWKRRRLGALGMAQPAHLAFVPVDFESTSLADGLAGGGFNAASPAVFSWIGVTMYLTIDAIRETLSAVAAGPPGTQIVLTYNLPPSSLAGMGMQTEQALRSIVTEMGEPMISVFDPADIERLVREVGFSEVAHFGPQEAVDTYFGGRDDVRFGGAQRIVIGRVTAS